MLVYFIIIFAFFALVFSYKRYLGKAALGILLQVFKVWYWLMGEKGAWLMGEKGAWPPENVQCLLLQI